MGKIGWLPVFQNIWGLLRQEMAISFKGYMYLLAPRTRNTLQRPENICLLFLEY